MQELAKVNYQALPTKVRTMVSFNNPMMPYYFMLCLFDTERMLP